MTDRRTRVLRFVGAALGVLLLAAAVFVLLQRREDVRDALDAISTASPFLIALLPLCVVANLALTGAMFHQLANRYGKVAMFEMQALIAASALANYLPLRPGFLGRVAYHKAVNDIAARHSVLTIAQAAGMTALGAMALLACALAAEAWPAMLAWMLPAPAIALLAIAMISGGGAARPWCLAGLARYLDLLVWTARYAIAFTLVGAPIELRSAVAFACVGTLATMVPLSSNGLGLREWAVGLLAAPLAAIPLETGMTAELVNRAAEVVVIVIAGLAGAAVLARRRPSRAASRPC